MEAKNNNIRYKFDKEAVKMEEKKNQKLNQELNEEMSLADLQETSGGSRKGNCGFTNEEGHCGFTCESDINYHDSNSNTFHCPECWSRNINKISESEFHEGFVPGITDTDFVATCEECGYRWHGNYVDQ